jgi:hypothetical protein
MNVPCAVHAADAALKFLNMKVFPAHLPAISQALPTNYASPKPGISDAGLLVFNVWKSGA